MGDDDGEAERHDATQEVSCTSSTASEDEARRMRKPNSAAPMSSRARCGPTTEQVAAESTKFSDHDGRWRARGQRAVEAPDQAEDQRSATGAAMRARLDHVLDDRALGPAGWRSRLRRDHGVGDVRASCSSISACRRRSRCTFELVTQRTDRPAPSTIVKTRAGAEHGRSSEPMRAKIERPRTPARRRGGAFGRKPSVRVSAPMADRKSVSPRGHALS